MNDRSYEGVLPALISGSGVTTIAADELVGYIIDWLEDDSGPFGDGWDMFRQMAPVVDQGDIADDAVPIAQLKASLTEHLTGRRLAWVLADLDGDVAVIADYLRHWTDDPDMAPRGTAVVRQLQAAHPFWLRTLEDSDARSRGFAASLLTQLREDQRPDANEEALLQAALDREADAVAGTALLLALHPVGNDPSATDDAVSGLAEAGGIDAIWGVKHPALPTIVGQAMARLSAGGS